MYARGNRLKGALVAFCAAAVCLCATAAFASADVASVYPPGAQSRDFAGGSGGWTSETPAAEGLLGGLCALVCPTVTNQPVAGGGVGGESDGFIETEEGGLLVAGLGAKSSGVWESPAFTYEGAAGQGPTKVEFSIARRADIASLLLKGAEAVYSVELFDKSSPSGTVFVINSAKLTADEEWKTTSASVDPSLLTAGDSYSVRVKTTFTTPLGVLPGGGVGYDNVALTAARVETTNGGNGTNGDNGNTGTNGTSTNGVGTNGTGGRNSANGTGTNGAKGSNGLSADQLRKMISSHGLVAQARWHGNWVVITGKCPKAIGRACTVRLRGMLNRQKTATVSRRAKIGVGARHQFIVSVRPGARQKVKGMRNILVKEWIRAGKTRVSVYKRLSLAGH